MKLIQNLASHLEIKQSVPLKSNVIRRVVLLYMNAMQQQILAF